MRAFAVFVAASRSSGVPSPRLVISIAESMSSWPSCSSVHCSDASSARRAPATAAMRNASSAAGSIDAAAAITARTSSTVITLRCCVFVDRSRASDGDVRRHPTPSHRLRERGAQHAVLVLDAGVGHARCRAGACASARRRRPSAERAATAAIWSFLIDLTRLC